MVCRRGSLYTNMISNVSKRLQNYPRINVLPLRFLSYGGIEMLLLCPPKANTLELIVFQEHMHTTIVHRTNCMPWLSTVICNNEHSGTDLLTFTVEPEAGRCVLLQNIASRFANKNSKWLPFSSVGPHNFMDWCKVTFFSIQIRPTAFYSNLVLMKLICGGEVRGNDF